MTLVSLTVSSPGMTTGFFTCYDRFGVAVAGVVVSLKVVREESGYGVFYDAAIRNATSSGAGLVQFANLIKGATYERNLSGSGKSVQVTIPTTAGATYELPSMIG